MTEQHILDPERVYEPEQQISSRRDNRREYRLQLLLTITALMCSSVEVELLQRLDGMREYMTLSEIFWDASVALLVVFGVIIGWWLCLLLTEGLPTCPLDCEALQVRSLACWVSCSCFVACFCSMQRCPSMDLPSMASWVFGGAMAEPDGGYALHGRFVYDTIARAAKFLPHSLGPGRRVSYYFGGHSCHRALRSRWVHFP